MPPDLGGLGEPLTAGGTGGEATYTKERHGILVRINLLLEKLRYLFRLAKDLRHLDLRRYEHASEELDEVGRLVGGWLKTQHAAG